jgi:hypothetical protein
VLEPGLRKSKWTKEALAKAKRGPSAAPPPFAERKNHAVAAANGVNAAAQLSAFGLPKRWLTKAMVESKQKECNMPSSDSGATGGTHTHENGSAVDAKATFAVDATSAVDAKATRHYDNNPMP